MRQLMLNELSNIGDLILTEGLTETLIHFWPMFLLYTLNSKPFGFLSFQVVQNMEHWPEMS